MSDPHAAADEADPKLAEHYATKNRRPSPFYARVLREEKRIKETGEVRRATCCICGKETIIDSIAFALGRLFTEQLVEEMHQPPLTPKEVGFTCSIDCHSEKVGRGERDRQLAAKAYRERGQEAVDDIL